MNVVSDTVRGAPVLRARVDICITPASPQPGATAEKLTDILGDLLMDTLLSSRDVVDPIVATDLDAQSVDVTFSFDAKGVVGDDSQRAMELLLNALNRVSDRLETLLEEDSDIDGTTRFDWKPWWDDVTQQQGSVQYPLVGIGAC